MGLYQARLTGEGMKDAGVRIDHVYSSPSFRCIQTTTSILEGLGLKDSHPIHVEPGLFEWLAWYQEGLPEWMSKEELVAADYNIVLDYEPLTKEDDLKARLQEGLEEFYQRNSSVTEHLINNTSECSKRSIIPRSSLTIRFSSRREHSDRRSRNDPGHLHATHCG